MKKLKLKILIPLLVVLIGAGVFLKMSKKPAVTHMKVTGAVYVLPQDFLVNLADGQFAKIAVALVLAPGQSDGASAGAGASSSDSSSQDVIGTLPEEPVVRSIVTNLLTNETSAELLAQSSRAQVEQRIRSSIREHTDVKVAQVLFPDLTVQ
jgi:flagellar basal body-associated protein FliL